MKLGEYTKIFFDESREYTKFFLPNWESIPKFGAKMWKCSLKLGELLTSLAVYKVSKLISIFSLNLNKCYPNVLVFIIFHMLLFLGVGEGPLEDFGDVGGGDAVLVA